MPEVSCADVGSDTCQTRFKAESKDELMRQVADHLYKVHNVKTPLVPKGVVYEGRSKSSP